MECLFSEGAPDEFLCQISLSVMRDPVVLPSGETYERNSIIRAGLRDPQTRQQLDKSQLTSNRALRRQIDKYLTSSVEDYVSHKIEGAKGVEGWTALSGMLECLIGDESEPALFAHKRVFGLLTQKNSLLEAEGSFVKAFPELTESAQETVLNTLMRIPSSLAKEGLYALLAQFNGYTTNEASQVVTYPELRTHISPVIRSTRNAHGGILRKLLLAGMCTLQRLIQSRPRIESVPPRRSTPAYVMNLEIVNKIGLHGERLLLMCYLLTAIASGLFSSHDSGEVELACNFALLFMQQPFQSNALNGLGLGEGENAHERSTQALKCMLSSKAIAEMYEVSTVGSHGADIKPLQLTTKQAMQEIVTTMSVWCSHQAASAAAKSILESEDQLTKLLWLFCGPPWVDITLSEPVLSALFCSTSEGQKEFLRGLLQSSCKPMLDWVTAEMRQLNQLDVENGALVDLLRSMAQIGYGIQQLMALPKKTKQLAEAETSLVRGVLLALVKELNPPHDPTHQIPNRAQSCLITNECIEVFLLLAQRSALSSGKRPSANGTAIATSLQVIANKSLLAFCAQPRQLFEACLKVAEAAREWAPPLSSDVALCEETALLLARDIAMQGCGGFRGYDAGVSCEAVPVQSVTQLAVALLQQPAELRCDSVAALVATHSIRPSDIEAEPSALQRVTKLQSELTQAILKLQPLCQHPKFAALAPWTTEDTKAMVRLLNCGLRTPIAGVLHHLFENESSAHAELAESLDGLIKLLEMWLRHSTSFVQLREPLVLMQSLAKQTMLRQEVTDSWPEILDLLHTIVRVDVQIEENVEAVVTAASVLNCLLAEKADSDATLPLKIVKKGILATLFNAMSALPEHRVLHEVGILVAFKLTSRCKDVEFSSAEMDVMLNAMWKWSAVGIRSPVFGIQMYLSTRKGYKQRLCKLDCVNVVLSAVEDRDADISVVRHGCGVLRNAARNVMEPESSSEGFPWRRMAAITIRLMKDHPLDRDIQYRGCGVLVNLVSPHEGALAARTELRCGTSVILEAARAHRNHAELQLWALHYYIQFDGEKESDQEIGPLPQRLGQELTVVMKTYKDNSELQLLSITVAKKLTDQYERQSCSKQLRNVDWAYELFSLTCSGLGEHMEQEDLCICAVQVLNFYYTHMKKNVTEWMKNDHESKLKMAVILKTLARAREYIHQHNLDHYEEDISSVAANCESSMQGLMKKLHPTR